MDLSSAEERRELVASTSLARIPVSPSNINVFGLPNTVIQDLEMHSNRSPVALEGLIVQADHRMQQSIKWQIGMPFSPPYASWSDDR